MTESGAAPRVHPTAIIETDVQLGPGTSIWDAVHIRRGARLGRNCIVGEKTYIAYDVRIGDLCKLNAGVYICAGVEIGTGVMIAAHVVFTNDRFPRACDADLRALQSSEPGPSMPTTRVGDGATIGANCTIGPGLELGAFCMVGMGSVVAADVPPHALVFGNPARLSGLVCRCGMLVGRAVAGVMPVGDYRCACGRSVRWPTTTEKRAASSGGTDEAGGDQGRTG